MTEKINSNKIKANNAFKKINIKLINFKNKKSSRKKNLSQDYLNDYEQELLLYSTMFDYNNSPISKKR